jgi:hypothetical protein
MAIPAKPRQQRTLGGDLRVRWCVIDGSQNVTHACIRGTALYADRALGRCGQELVGFQRRAHAPLTQPVETRLGQQGYIGVTSGQLGNPGLTR